MSKLKEFVKKRQEIKKSMALLKCQFCSSTLFKSGDSHITGCMCFGFSSIDENSKVSVTKTESGVSLGFNKKWDEENIQMLMEMITKSK